MALHLCKLTLYGKPFHRWCRPLRVRVMFHFLFIWIPRQISLSLLNLKCSLWCRIRRKLAHDRSSKKETKSNNTACHLQGLCRHADTSLAFHSTSHTKHKKRLKPCGKLCPVNYFLCIWLQPFLKKLYT